MFIVIVIPEVLWVFLIVQAIITLVITKTFQIISKYMVLKPFFYLKHSWTFHLHGKDSNHFRLKQINLILILVAAFILTLTSYMKQMKYFIQL